MNILCKGVVVLDDVCGTEGIAEVIGVAKLVLHKVVSYECFD